MAAAHKFTAIMDTYYRPKMLKQAVDALLRQTHENLEIILIDNGGTLETKEYLHEAESEDSRIRLLHFEENQFSWDDPLKMLDTCLNPALEMATGDYVWYQADDDLISDDYAEKMVALFNEDRECTTAAGLPMSVDVDGNLRDVGPRVNNFRPRHMPGRELVLKIVRGDRSLFGAPGSIFTIQRDALVKSGGYHRNLENGHLYGIVPFGVTGFDETAYAYWRYHSGQLHRSMSTRGLIGTKETFSLLREWDIKNRWQVFGSDEANEVSAYLHHNACSRSAAWFVRLFYSGHFPGVIRILGTTWSHGCFWGSIPRNLTQVQWFVFALRDGSKRILKGLFKGLFSLWPGLARVSPRLETLRQRANR